MAKTILVASGKGGVGKSTSVCGIGRALAARGKRTLLVDCDDGLNSLNVMLGCADRTVFSWYDVYTGACEAQDAPVQVNEYLSLLSAPVSPLDDDLSDAVSRAVAPFLDRFDFILFDAPAGLGRGFRRALAAAGTALIIATADEVSVRGAAAVRTALQQTDVNELRLLLNRYEPRAAKHGNYLTIDEAIDKTGIQLIGVLPEDKEIKYSTVTGTIRDNCRSARAFKRIAKRICGEEEPLTLSILK